MRRHPRTGALGPILSQTATPAPSFVALHPHLPMLYAVNEVDPGTIAAFALDRDAGEAGMLPVASCPTGGASPCHAFVDATGSHHFVANYGGGSVAAVRLDASGSRWIIMSSATVDGVRIRNGKAGRMRTWSSRPTALSSPSTSAPTRSTDTGSIR